MSNKVETKLPKGVDQTFADNIQSMSTDQLKALIVELQVRNEENEAFKQSEGYLIAQDRLKAERERFNEIAGPVLDTTKSLKGKTKLVIERLKEKGVV